MIYVCIRFRSHSSNDSDRKLNKVLEGLPRYFTLLKNITLTKAANFYKSIRSYHTPRSDPTSGASVAPTSQFCVTPMFLLLLTKKLKYGIVKDTDDIYSH
jgi:hypothetical protein